MATVTVAYKVAQYAKFTFHNALDAGGSRTEVFKAHRLLYLSAYGSRTF